MAFLIIILIISQLVAFYIIILLNAKVSKFKDLEVRQDRLIREMDDAIGVYLMEMREENDRLIKELSSVNSINYKNVEKSEQKVSIIETDETNSMTTSPNEALEKDIVPKIIIPKSIAQKAYGQYKSVDSHTETELLENDEQVIPPKNSESDHTPSFEQQVLNLHREGKTVEQIAKITQKGKTEIELLLKFHS